MTTTENGPEEIRAAVLRVLTSVAPEIEPEAVRPDAPWREQFDIDSIDFLNFVIGLSEELGVDVPEADYSKLYTLDGCVDYLLTATSTGRAGSPGFP
jgi:acyl carrier protein